MKRWRIYSEYDSCVRIFHKRNAIYTILFQFKDHISKIKIYIEWKVFKNWVKRQKQNFCLNPVWCCLTSICISTFFVSLLQSEKWYKSSIPINPYFTTRPGVPLVTHFPLITAMIVACLVKMMAKSAQNRHSDIQFIQIVAVIQVIYIACLWHRIGNKLCTHWEIVVNWPSVYNTSFPFSLFTIFPLYYEKKLDSINLILWV